MKNINISDIIITKADKSNTIVNLDKPSYIKEAERQLNAALYDCLKCKCG